MGQNASDCVPVFDIGSQTPSCRQSGGTYCCHTLLLLPWFCFDHFRNCFRSLHAWFGASTLKVHDRNCTQKTRFCIGWYSEHILRMLPGGKAYPHVSSLLLPSPRVICAVTKATGWPADDSSPR